MKTYLALVPRYLQAHRKRTRRTVFGIVLSVALVTGIFSMLDVFLKYERAQIIKDVGLYHLSLESPDEQERKAINGRMDVERTGMWVALEDGAIGDRTIRIAAIEQSFAEHMNIEVVEGAFPTARNELMIEQWASERLYLNVGVNDTVVIEAADGSESEWRVSGIYSDIGHLKASGEPGVLLSVEGALTRMTGKMQSRLLIAFKPKANIGQAEQEIKDGLNIADDRIGRNTRLLAVMGQSASSSVAGLYATGGILFCIVLAAGVIMIANMFSISVTDRVRQFGLLRCIGASQSQIRKMVRREGSFMALTAIPVGVAVGLLVTFACSALLKYYNKHLFGDMPLFSISWTGIAAGAVIGLLTVFTASFWPARRAARVSPLVAVTGGEERESGKARKNGWLTRMFRAEVALGVNNAVARKRTFMLMSASIAISIVMFLGFQVFIDFLHASMKTTKPYTPDVSLVSTEGMDRGLHDALARMDGVKRVYGRMFAHRDVAFDAARLTDLYKEQQPELQVKEDGTFVPPNSSWFISYDQDQLRWAKEDLLAGQLSEEALNEQEGVIAVVVQSGRVQAANLRVGDNVYMDTVAGRRALTVIGVLRSVPFHDSQSSLATFITSEANFVKWTGESNYRAIDIQLDKQGGDMAVDRIKAAIDSSVTFLDARQKNAEIDQTFFTMAVFLYGFVAVIAMISLLNIVNTMHTSVVSKTRYFGVMRAVGMSGGQLQRMVLVEAAAYSLTGWTVGCVVGVALQKWLIHGLLVSFPLTWEFPFAQLIVIFVVVFLLTMLSVAGPLKRVKRKGIAELVGSL